MSCKALVGIRFCSGRCRTNFHMRNVREEQKRGRDLISELSLVEEDLEQMEHESKTNQEKQATKKF